MRLRDTNHWGGPIDLNTRRGREAPSAFGGSGGKEKGVAGQWWTGLSGRSKGEKKTIKGASAAGNAA